MVGAWAPFSRNHNAVGNRVRHLFHNNNTRENINIFIKIIFDQKSASPFGLLTKIEYL